MTLRPVLAVVLLAALSTACTPQEPRVADGASDGGPSGSARRQDEGARRPARPSAGGPLTVDRRGSLCIDTTINDKRQYTYGEDLLRTSEPVDVDSVALVRPRGIRVLRAWTFTSRGIPYSGSWSGWPLPERVTSHGRLEWDERVEAEGSHLEPGNLYNFLVRMGRDPGNEAQGFDSIRVAYHTSDRSHVLRTGTKVRFQRECR